MPGVVGFVGVWFVAYYFYGVGRCYRGGKWKVKVESVRKLEVQIRSSVEFGMILQDM